MTCYGKAEAAMRARIEAETIAAVVALAESHLGKAFRLRGDYGDGQVVAVVALKNAIERGEWKPK